MYVCLLAIGIAGVANLTYLTSKFSIGMGFRIQVHLVRFQCEYRYNDTVYIL